MTTTSRCVPSTTKTRTPRRFPTITTWAMPFISCGSTATWPIPAPTSRPAAKPLSKPSKQNSVICVENCVCSLANICWMSVAVGAGWRALRPESSARKCSALPSAKSNWPWLVNALTQRGWRTWSNCNCWIIAIYRRTVVSTKWSASACSNTSGMRTWRSTARPCSAR
ncbi:hypothetical protein D3C84_761550 [compost metagenome]